MKNYESYTVILAPIFVKAHIFDKYGNFQVLSRNVRGIVVYFNKKK